MRHQTSHGLGLAPALRACFLALAIVLGLGAAIPGRAAAQTAAISTCLWDTGAFDQRTAQWSLTDYTFGDQQTADDFYLPPGSMYRLDKFTATLFGSSILPKARLKLYEDCNGVPGNLLLTLESTSMTDLNQPYSGMRTFKAEFTPSNLWLPGDRQYWVSVMGVRITSDDQWWWATAGAGKIMGLPGMYRAVNAGFPNWVSVATFGCGCTDFVFRVEGEACKILRDNGPPDAVAGGSLSIDNQTLVSARAADDFETTTCDDATVCFLKAVVYSNCSPLTGKFEIYSSACTLPNSTPLFSTPFSRVVDLGYTVNLGTGALRAYEVQAYNLSWVLPKGAKYWLSAVSDGGSLQARTYLAFSNRCDQCSTNLSEGAATGLLVGQTTWVPVEQVVGQPRDFSFLIAVKTPASTQQNAAPQCPADFDGDGFVRVADLFKFLTAWFAGCH